MRRRTVRTRILILAVLLAGAAVWGLASTRAIPRLLAARTPTYESVRAHRRAFTGTHRLKAGDSLPACTPVLFDKQADAGGDPKNHPVFIFWVGFEDSSGRLLDIDDAEAYVRCKYPTRGARLVTKANSLFDRYVAIALEHVPVSGAKVHVELVGKNGVVSSFILSTNDRPDPRGRNASFWRKKSE